MKQIRNACLAGLLAVAAVTPAQATIVTVFDDRDGGAANFDATVAAAGGTSNTEQVVAGQTSYTDFTLSQVPGGPYTSGLESTTGGVVDISPSGSGSDPLNYRPSGFSIDFGSTLLNSIGFEVGDWGTCCDPSALYISFDNGAAIQVGLYDGTNDTALTNGEYIVFVGAFDDSGTFSTVQFWGDGVGEFLTAGGTIRYALVDQGSLPPSGVPEPATWAMMLMGFGAAGLSIRRKRRSGQKALAQIA